MKTKTFLLLCLFLGIGLLHLSAQNGKNGTGTVVYHNLSVDAISPLPVICDGVMVDEIQATNFTIQVLEHWNKGEVVSYHEMLINVECFSVRDGETFKFSGSDRYYPEGEFPLGLDYLHFNIRGDRGTHYIVHILWDGDDIVETHASCH